MAGCKTPHSCCHRGTSWTSPTKASRGPSPCFSPPACCRGSPRWWILRLGVRRRRCWWGHWTAHCTKQVSSVRKSFQRPFLFSLYKVFTASRKGLHTHPALVCAGLCWALIVNRKKYSGMEMPRKSEMPMMKRLRIEFMLVNCIKESPTAPEKIRENRGLRELKSSEIANPIRNY